MKMSANSCEISQVQIEKAVKALLVHGENKRKSEPMQLIESAQSIWAVISLKTIPQKNRATPVKIELPFSILPEDATVCLITKDPQREFKDLLASKKITCISKVIGVTKLRQKYKPYEAKRQLCASYDCFLADERVLPLLPKLLGKTFFDKKKLPMNVNMKKQELGKEIQSALSSTCFYLSPGACTSVRIGSDQMDAEKVVANIQNGLPLIAEHIPGGWANVQSVHLKTGDSIALPIYCSLPDHPESESVKKAEAEKAQKRAAADALTEKPELTEEERDRLFMKRLMKRIKLKI